MQPLERVTPSLSSSTRSRVGRRRCRRLPPKNRAYPFPSTRLRPLKRPSTGRGAVAVRVAGEVRLHDTRLEPAHERFRLAELALLRTRLVGGCTSPVLTVCHLLCLLSRFARLSRDERPEGRGPAFAGGDEHPYPPDYRAAFASSLLLCPHTPEAPLTLGCPLAGRASGLPRSVRWTGFGVGSLFPPAALGAHDGGSASPRTRSGAVLAPASQHPLAGWL